MYTAHRESPDVAPDTRCALSLVIFPACLPSLIHCSAVPRSSVSVFATMDPTRRNNAPRWNSTFANRQAVFQEAAR